MGSVTRGSIQIPRKELNLKMMLEGGQSFRWRRKGSNSWVGVHSRIVWTLEQTEDTLSFVASSGPKSSSKGAEEILRNYLRLNEPLNKFYEEWAFKDLNFKKAAEQCFGIRMLNQDPVENLFSFICSSNNNIIRISSMVEKMCSLYGDKLYEVDGQSYYAFPEISSLAQDTIEDALRKAGFGYRAKYIQQAAKQLMENGGLDWLTTLKTKSYQEAKSALMTLQGIGPKVADCICLMSLGHLNAVPVDTHVFQIACQYYLPHLKSCKSVTEKVYKEIGDFFRELYGPMAGWAHTVLFCADLKMFKGDSNGNVENGKKRKSESPTQNGVSEPFLESVSGTVRCTAMDLNLKVTFNCGQTYRWKEIEPNVWRGIFANRVWTLRQRDKVLEYTMNHFVVPRKAKTKKLDKEKECESLLRDYFRLDEPLHGFYEEWARRDSHFAEVSKVVFGLRMTKQDIVENLFAFICSSNNTITRITSMVESLCKLYGSKIAELDGVSYFAFPSVSSLSAVEVEKDLRVANFGFRAKYVHQAAVYIMEKGGSDWFSKLQQMDYANAKMALMQLPGVGAKVADCICLTALNHLDTIPVDTHVFQIAKQHYLTQYKDKKSVSEKIYAEIGDRLRTVFGHYAGWAHTVLFCSDLKMHGLKKKTG